MAAPIIYKRAEDISAEDKARYRAEADSRRAVIQKGFWGGLNSLPFVGKWFEKKKKCDYIEAAYYFMRTNEPVIDQKMHKALVARHYEWKFHMLTGFAWSGVTFMLPAWRGWNFSSRVGVSSLPFFIALYRGFRRGHDHVIYVGETFMEHHLRRVALLKYLRDNDDYLPEFKDWMVKSGLLSTYLNFYGLKPMATIEDIPPLDV